jgi:membrane protein YdbS with pleckstrin-like domain
LFANRVANQVANHVEIGIVVALVALLSRIMSVPIIALFLLGIVFSEILLIVLVGYVIWRYTVKTTEIH